MIITDLIRALRWIGPGPVWESMRFAWTRDRWQAKTNHDGPGPRRTPGKLQRVEPLSDGAHFVFKNAELELHFLSRWAVRIEWGPGTPPPPYSHARAQTRFAQVDTQPQENGWQLSTPELSVDVDDEGRIGFKTAEGDLLREDGPPARGVDSWVQESQLRPEERIFGLGERAAGLNLRPGEYRLWNTDAGGSYTTGEDPLYFCVPILVGLHSAGGYLVYYENPHDGRVRLKDRAEVTFHGGQHRYVFISGTPPRALERLTRVLGRPALPPRWALGYHQSRWGYASEQDVRQVIDGFEHHGLPLAALHLDIDYMRGYRIFTVDHERFPNLGELAEECERRLGTRLVAIIDPGVKVDPEYEIYCEGLDAGHFCTLPDGSPLRGSVWPGAVHYPDFSDPRVRRWWGDHYAELLDLGITGIWHDMNEPTSFAAWGDTTFPLPTRHEFDGQPGDHRAGHNLYGHLMNQAAYEALRRHRPKERPFLLSRSGWAGSARYAWTWTGDTASTWEALRQTVPTVLGLGLSGTPFSGPDIGGFSGDPGMELFLRWFQLGALLPFFRTHSSKSSPPREPWQYGEEGLRIARKFLRLRRSLLPYLYTLAAQAHHTGWPMVRPLFWEQPGAPSLWDVDDAYLLGDRLLVAPIFRPGATRRSLILPPGRWYDFWQGVEYEGPGEITVPAPLDRIPLFVRAGSALPLADEETLELHIYPPIRRIEDQPVYTDEGDGFGPSRWDYFSVHPQKHGLEITWRAEGKYPWPYPHLNLVFHGGRASRLRLDGRRIPVEGNLVQVPRFHRAGVLIRTGGESKPP